VLEKGDDEGAKEGEGLRRREKRKGKRGMAWTCDITERSQGQGERPNGDERTDEMEASKASPTSISFSVSLSPLTPIAHF